MRKRMRGVSGCRGPVDVGHVKYRNGCKPSGQRGGTKVILTASPRCKPKKYNTQHWHQRDGVLMPPLPPGNALPEGWYGSSWVQAGGWGVTHVGPPWGQQLGAAADYAAARNISPQAMQFYTPQQQTALASMPGGQPRVHIPQQQVGVIFLCDSRTEEECLQRGLFGLPATQTQIVRTIVPEATLLFLFNVCIRMHA